jgi:hypothetical protein
MTLTDNGDGTALISGIPTSSLVVIMDTCLPEPCGIIAKNSESTVFQKTVFRTYPAPRANIVQTGLPTFIAGTPSTAVVSTVGAVTPITWTFRADPNATWLKGKANGDGTFLLFGTPPFGTFGKFTPELTAIALYSSGVVTPYTVNVQNISYFTTPNVATFTVGANSLFEVSTNQGAIRPLCEA